MGGKPMGGKDMGKGCWGGGWDAGWGGGWGGGKGGGKSPYGSPNGVKRKPEDTGEVFTGTVKSTSQKFGFIQSEEVTQKYGQDCFCLGEQLMSFSVGEAVQFTV